jgi:hypothetical protein
MKLKYSAFTDFFLLKKDLYSKLTDKSMWLYIGIVLIGIRDVAFAIFGSNSSNTDYSKIIGFNIKTIGLLMLTALVTGLLDALCFSYPVFDIIKHFKNKNESNSMALGMLYSSLLTKVIKVYAIANIIITPLDILNFIVGKQAIASQSVMLSYIYLALGIIEYFWFNGAITRGLCVLFKLPNNVRGLIFMLVFLWNALISWAIGYLLNVILIRI